MVSDHRGFGSIYISQSVADAFPEKGTYKKIILPGGCIAAAFAGDRLFAGLSGMVCKIWDPLHIAKLCFDHISMYDHKFCKLAELSYDADIHGDIQCYISYLFVCWKMGKRDTFLGQFWDIYDPVGYDDDIWRTEGGK